MVSDRWFGLSALMLVITLTCNAEEPRFPLRLYGLDYPRIAIQAGLRGTVILRCALRGDGTVRSATYVSGPIALADAASANALKWKFRQPNGKDDGELMMIYRFELRETVDGLDSKSEFVFESPNVITVYADRLRVMPVASDK
jgi:TonB family protein